MAHRPTFALAAAVLTGVLVGGTPAHSPAHATVATATPEQREMVEWALDRFEGAGLRLPLMVIDFPGRDLALCGGAPARAYLAESPVMVKACWNDPFMLLHELAHVWEAVNMPASRQEPFMYMRVGVRSWAGTEHAWEEQGREHAANVIAWGLLEDPYPPSRTYPNDPRSLTEAFRLLAGTEPLHDGGPGIQHPDRSLSAGRSNTPLESGR